MIERFTELDIETCENIFQEIGSRFERNSGGKRPRPRSLQINELANGGHFHRCDWADKVALLTCRAKSGPYPGGVEPNPRPSIEGTGVFF